MIFTADDYRAAAANTRNNPKMQAMLNQAAVDRDTLDEMTAPRCDTAPFTGPVVGYEPETVWSLGCERGRLLELA